MHKTNWCAVKIFVMRNITVIVNPTAGRGRAKKYWPEVKNALRRLGGALHIEVTEKRGDAHNIARSAAGNRTSLIVAVGGDGTAHEAANGILEAAAGKESIPLAVIPLGNGDDFVKMLPPMPPIGKQGYSWQDAVEKIAEGATARYDAGKIVVLESGIAAEQGSSRFFINGMNLGFTAHAAHNFSSIPKFLTGSAGYLAAVLKTLWYYPNLDLQMAFDDKPPESISTSLAALMNGRCFGQAFWVAPHADASDGLLEIIFTEKIGRLAILQKLPLLLKGNHVNDPVVHWRRAAKIAISSPTPLIVEADGETVFTGASRLEVQLLPAALTVVV